MIIGPRKETDSHQAPLTLYLPYPYTHTHTHTHASIVPIRMMEFIASFHQLNTGIVDTPLIGLLPGRIRISFLYLYLLKRDRLKRGET